MADEFPQYKEEALRERHKELIREFYLFRAKLEAHDFTEEEIAWHGEDPLEEVHWQGFVTGWFIGKGLSVGEAIALAIYIY